MFFVGVLLLFVFTHTEIGDNASAHGVNNCVCAYVAPTFVVVEKKGVVAEN